MVLGLCYGKSEEQLARWLIDGLVHGRMLTATSVSKRDLYTFPVDSVLPYRLPDLLVADFDARKILCAIDVSRHAPMGQNPNQSFDKLVGCARIGVPYICMFPFSAVIPRSDGTSSVEWASSDFFYALLRAQRLHTTPVAAVPWPGSLDGATRAIGDTQDVPSPDTPEAKALFAFVDHVIQTHLDSGQLPSHVPAVEPWNLMVREKAREPLLPPDSGRAYQVIATERLGDYLRNYFPILDADLSDLPAHILERAEIVITPTDSSTFRADPFAGTMFVYDYALCRRDANITQRERSIMPHFRTRSVADALRLVQKAPTQVSRRGPIHFVSPDVSTREALRQMPSVARQFLVGADAIIFVDGIIVPNRFLLPTQSPFSHKVPRNAGPRLLLFVEGKDVPLLDGFARALGCTPISSHENIECETMGGGDAPGFAKTAMKLERKKSHGRGGAVKGFAIRDRDYKPPENHERYRADLEGHGIKVHIWNRKEIENYLIVPSLLARAIREALSVDPLSRQRTLPVLAPPSAKEVEDALMEVTNRFKNYVLSRLAYDLALEFRGDNTLPQRLESMLDSTEALWATPEGRFSLVPGDAALSAFRRWARDKYQVTITTARLLSLLEESDVDPEMREVIEQIVSLANGPG